MRSFTDISLCSRASVGIFLQMFINLGVFITLARGTLGSNRFQVRQLLLNFYIRKGRINENLAFTALYLLGYCCCYGCYWCQVSGLCFVSAKF